MIKSSRHLFCKFTKTATLAASIALFSGVSLAHDAPRQAEAANVAVLVPQCGSKLANVQQCISAAALQAYRDGDTSRLVAIANTMRGALATDRGPQLHYRTYWLAYTDYLTASQALGAKNLQLVASSTLEAATLLDRIDVKDEETYALQDLVLLMSFVVTPPSDIGPLLSQTSELRSRLGTAPFSIRALYALGVADHYTPKQYGGGRLAEALLRQAVKAPAEPASLVKPTWGRDDCAALLIQILQENGKADEATKVLAQWHHDYPDSVALAQLTGKH